MSKQLVTDLIAIGNGEMKIQTGLCMYMSIMHNVKYSLMDVLFPMWEGFSGNISYPVSHPTMQPWDAYNSYVDSTKWGDHKYGDNRRALALFLAEYFKEVGDKV